MNQLKQAILDFVANNPSDSYSGFELAVLSVTSVDIDRRVLDAVDANAHTFHSLHLQFIGASIFVVPAVGSSVLACINQHLSVGFVISCSLIESAHIVIGSSSAVIDADGVRFDSDQSSAHFNNSDIVFNGGSLNGLPVIDDLTQRLNIIENDINSLKAVFASQWLPTPQDGGAALKAAATSWAASSLTPTKSSDYENTKIKQ